MTEFEFSFRVLDEEYDREQCLTLMSEVIQALTGEKRPNDQVERIPVRVPGDDDSFRSVASDFNSSYEVEFSPSKPFLGNIEMTCQTTGDKRIVRDLLFSMLETRMAFIINNSVIDLPELQQLRDHLEYLGFSLHERRNASIADMNSLTQKIKVQSGANDGCNIFLFIGHSCSAFGQTILFSNELEPFPLSNIFEAFSKNTGLNIIFSTGNRVSTGSEFRELVGRVGTGGRRVLKAKETPNVNTVMLFTSVEGTK